MAMSHLPGLPLVSAVAMGIGAMSAVMLKLVVSARLTPAPRTETASPARQPPAPVGSALEPTAEP